MNMLAPERVCSCGSGRPARACCGWFRRVGERQAAVAFLGRQERQARDLLGGFSPVALAALQAEAATLPGRCERFGTSLLSASHAVTSAVANLGRAMGQGGGPVESDALRRADTPMARAVVAETLLALRGAGVVDEYLVAAALLGLAGRHSALGQAALRAAARRGAGSRAAGLARSTTPTDAAEVGGRAAGGRAGPDAGGRAAGGRAGADAGGRAAGGRELRRRATTPDQPRERSVTA